MGEAAGVAAALALNAGVTVRNVDVGAVQKALRAQGADPGDHEGRNADVPDWPVPWLFAPKFWRPYEFDF